MTQSKYFRDKVPKPDDVVTFNEVSITHQQVNKVVVSFYTEVENDELLSGPFSKVANWDHHFEIMTNFWWARMGGGNYIYYPYNPFQKHYENGFNAELLSRWLELFKSALSKHLDESQIQAWLLLAEAIGNNLLSKNNDLIRMLNSK